LARTATLQFLVAVAGESDDDIEESMAHILGSIGWLLRGGTPTIEGRLFARAALTTWPK